MRNFYILLLICVFGSVQAESDQSNFYTRLLSAPEVTGVTPCFSGKFLIYEDWQSFVVGRSHHLDVDSFEEAFNPEAFERYKSNIDCAFFTYSVDGLEIGGYALTQKESRNFPVVVFNRGGTGTFGNVKFASLFNRPFLLAEQKLFVIGSQYRGGLGKPVEVGGVDEWGGADVRDVLALAPIIEHLEEADADRVGMYGGSRGSVNTFQAMQEFPNVKTVVSVSGVYDLEHELQARPRMNQVLADHIPEFQEHREEELSKRSVVKWVDKLDLNIPILLIHGAYDERATANGALKFAQLLQQRFHAYKLVIYERDDHFLSENSDSVDETIIDWFETYLR